MREGESGNTFFFLVLLGSAVLILYFQVFVWLISSWEFNPYYSHGILIPLISGFLVLLTWRGERKNFTPGPSIQGMVLIVVGMLVHIAGYWYSAFWIAALSLIPVLLGLLSFVSGWKNTSKFLFPAFFLVFMIPFPFIDTLATGFAAFSVFCSSVVIQLCGIPVVTNGAELVLPGSAFRIGLSCSGLKTMISLLIPSTLLIELCVCRTGKKILLFLLIFPLAFITNILRILVLVAVTNVYGTEFAMKNVHDVMGLLMPVLVFLGILALARFMGCSAIKKFNNQ